MSDREFRGDVRQVRQIAELPPGTVYNRLWQPFVAQWASGHLVVAYGVHLRGKIDMGDIVASISTDNGDTWLPPVRIFDHSPTGGGHRVAYANPVLYRPPGQEILWCYAMRCPLSYRDSEESELCAAYSADGGWSWQQVELAVHHHAPLITCAGIVAVRADVSGDPSPADAQVSQAGSSPVERPAAVGFQSGGQTHAIASSRTRYLLPVHNNSIRHDPRGVQDQFVLESTSLLEWKLAGYVPRPASVFPHEGNLSADPQTGTLRIVMRTATAGAKYDALDTPVAYSAESTDGGRTWSDSVPEPELHNTAGKAFYGHAGDGTEVYIYSPGPRGERKSLRYRVRRPGTDQWGEDRLFYDGDNRNSYPTLLETEPGRFAAVWDSSNDPDVKRTSIRFGWFSP